MKPVIIMVTAVLPVIAACNKSQIGEETTGASSELKVDIRTGSQSKALVTGSTLDDGSEVGTALFGTDGNVYDGLPYGNVRYTAQASSSVQTWKPDIAVMLSASKATLYSYYPYSPEVTSIRSIPVKADSSTQTDVMFGTPVHGLYNHSSSASITLNHALSAIRVSLKRGTYSGEGKVTSISIKGGGIAVSCNLDAVTGTLSSFSGENTAISPPIVPFNISSTGRDFDVIVIPNGQKAQLEINAVIDDETFSLTTDSITLVQGSLATYNITVNNGGSSISGMTVNEWGYTLEADHILEKTHSITMTGDMEGISFDHKINDDGSVQIIAVPYSSEDAEVNPVDFTGNATLTQESYQGSGARIITLSDIQSDVSLVFNGYCLWMTAIYEITDISSPSSIYYATAGRTNNPVRMQVDDVEMTPAATYSFQSAGEHKVRFAFKDKTDIGYSFFSDINTLIAARIPEGVSSVGHSVFFGCRRLASVSLPESAASIGYECFRDAISLESITIPENALSLGTALFRGCTGLKTVMLPTGLSKLPDTIFRECTSLDSIKLHEGLTIIGSSAFIYSGIRSIDLPSSLTYLDSDALSNCYYLSSITCRACVPPEMYTHSDIFTGIKSNGTVYVPSGSETAYQDQWLKGQLLSKNWTISTIQ